MLDQQKECVMEALYYIIPFAIILYFVIKRNKKGSGGTGTGGPGDGDTGPVKPPSDHDTFIK